MTEVVAFKSHQCNQERTACSRALDPCSSADIGQKELADYSQALIRRMPDCSGEQFLVDKAVADLLLER